MRRRRVGDQTDPDRRDDSGGDHQQQGLDESRDSSVQQATESTQLSNEDDSFRCTCRIPRWLFWGVFAFVVSTVIMLAGYVGVMHFFLLRRSIGASTSMMDELGVDGVMLFRQYDRDDDGYLSLGEFEPLAHLLRQTNSTFEYPVEIADTDEMVTIKAFMSPLNLSTMTKDMNSMFSGSLDALIGLKSWQKPNIAWLNFGVSEFQPFLPKSESDFQQLGKAYDIIIFSKGGFFDAPLSNNRYYPPRVKDEEVVFHRLLTLLHPRPFIHSRFAPQGSIACVRGYNDRFLDIVFRIHAEFQLNEPPFHPFWFTPAQFTGRLIITRNASNIYYFNMFVPATKKLNVDMEWLNGPREMENMEVDIGYLPLMELNVTSSSMPAVVTERVEGMTEPQAIRLTETALPEHPGLKDSVEELKWTEEISMEEAARKLEVHMYKFKQVPYLNFSDAYVRAAAENKLVHSILLWGALDDQSC